MTREEMTGGKRPGGNDLGGNVLGAKRLIEWYKLFSSRKEKRGK